MSRVLGYARVALPFFSIFVFPFLGGVVGRRMGAPGARFRSLVFRPTRLVGEALRAIAVRPT